MYSIFIVLIAFFLAIIEIEIEGCQGWAENLPTAKLVDTKRSLTVYHLYMFSFVLLILCGTFFVKSYDYTFYDFLYILTMAIMVVFLEDIYWFVLNPCYGFKRIADVWWHAKWGPIPIIYVFLPIIIVLLAWWSGYIDTFGRSLVTILGGTLVIFALSPLYQMLYKWLHRSKATVTSTENLTIT
jgi:hypothetical protein